MADGSVIIDTKLDKSGFKTGLAELGKVAAVGIGATVSAMAAAGTAAVKFGSEFETSMAKASTLFGDVDVSSAVLEKNLLSLSGAAGLTATSIGDSLYTALSAGIPATEDMAEATGFLEKNAQLATAGFTDIDTAVSATAKVLNAYGMNVSETDAVHKILMQTQNKGITTVGELGEVLAQVTPTAAAMSFSFEQVGASLATMTAQGIPTAQATTSLNGLLAELGKSGTVANKALGEATIGTKYAGKSFNELMAEGVPITDLLSLMSDYAGKNNLQMLDMFSSIEAGKGALALFNGEGKVYMSNLDAMSTSADVVGDAYAKMMDTFDKQKDVFINGAKNLGIAAYDNIQEPLKNAAKFGTEQIGILSAALSEGGLSGLADAAGTVLSNIVSKIVEFAPKIIDAALSLISALITGIVQNIPAIAETTVTIVNSLVTSLLGLLPTIIDAGTKLFIGLVQGLGELLPTLIPALIDAVLKIAQVLVDNAPLLIDAAVVLFEGLVDGLIEAIPVIVKSLPKLINGVLSGLTKMIPALIDCGIKLFVALVEALPVIVQSIADILPELITGIVTELLKMTPVLVKCGITLFVALLKAVPQIVSALSESLWSLVVGLVDTILSFASMLVDAGKELLMNIWQGIAGEKDEFVGNVSSIWQNIIGMLKDAWASIVSFFTTDIPAFLQSVVAWFTELPRNMGLLIGQTLGHIIKFGLDLWNWVTVDLPEIINGIVDWFAQLPSRIFEWLTQAAQNIASWAIDIKNKAVEAATNFVGSVITFFTELPGKMWSCLAKAGEKVSDFAINLINTAKVEIPKFVTSVTDIIKDLPGKFFDIGANIIKGMWDGILAMKNWLVGNIKDFCKGFVDGFNNAFEIRSPSALFRDHIGKNLMLGLVEGIDGQSKTVGNSMAEIAKIVTDTDFPLPNPFDAPGFSSGDIYRKVVSTVEEYPALKDINANDIYRKISATVDYATAFRPGELNARSGEGSRTIVVQAGDVYLDGEKISSSVNKHNYAETAVRRVR